MRLADIFLSDAAARAICWTLIHSLWQGILIAALAGLIIYGTRKLPAAIRYNLLAIDWLVFLLLAGITFGYELHHGTPGSGPAAAPIVLASGRNVPATTPVVVLRAGHPDLRLRINDYLNSQAPIITIVWLACLSIQLLRFSGGLYQVRRIRRKDSQPAETSWAERLTVLTTRLGIRRPVRLLESVRVRTPSAIGWWKPSILVPLGLLANLPPDQVETILLHELAHIYRNDYVTNLVLHLTEAVFFFNPGLRWVAALLRREREACCDDMVLAGTPDRNSYLEALVTFTQWVVDDKPAAIRHYAPQFSGGNTDLLWRVRRMLKKENKKLQPKEKLILSFGLMALLTVSMLSMHPGTPRPHPVLTPHASPAPHPTLTPHSALSPLPDTVPAPRAHSDQKQVTIEQLSINSRTNNGRSKYYAKATDQDGNHYEVRRQNGEVTEFRLNGQLIPKAEYDRYSAVLDSIESARLHIKVPEAPPPPPAIAAPPASATSGTSSAPREPDTLLHFPATPPKPDTILKSHVVPAAHAPTPDDPMVYAAFQNPYAKNILLDLIHDGLAGDLKDVSFVLNVDEMIVNHVRQPDNIFQNYRQKYIQSAGDHMIYSQQYTPHSQGAHCECVHDPDMPYIPAAGQLITIQR